MCGIAGRVNKLTPPSRRQIDAMSDLIAHRGPDGHGLFIDGRAALAHRRLAIVDVGGGAQPVYGEGRRYVLVYNGEVYNHAGLRTELEGKGHEFHTRCDTEAILHAHEEWGIGAASRLRGMFAYAAWDRLTRTLTLVRDPMGIKPVYYAHLPGGDLLFASELKPLLVEPEVDRTIDDDALACYLALRYVPGPATIVRGVRKLMPGHALTWRDGGVAVQQYWQVPVGGGAAPPTFAEAGGRLCELLDEVVSLCRMSDVPLGSLLSGGLDSTLVSGLLANLARREGADAPHTFSVGYVGSKVEASSELDWARLAAKRMGTRHHEVVVTGADVARDLGQIVWNIDEPLGDPSCAPMWYLSRLAREHVTVVLSGEGADEVFAGYGLYARLGLARRVRPYLGGAASLIARLADGKWRRLAELVARGDYRGVSRAFDDAERPAWGAPDAVERALGSARAHAAKAPTFLGRLLAFDQQVWLPDDILLKSDRMSMAHALELRPPLLDHRMIEEVSSWPDAWKQNGSTSKAILRHAADGVVPREILERTKMGFGTPYGTWLREELRTVAEDRIAGRGSLAWQRGELPLVRRLLKQHAGGRDRADELWALLTLETWLQDVLPRVETVAPDLAEPAADSSIGLTG